MNLTMGIVVKRAVFGALCVPGLVLAVALTWALARSVSGEFPWGEAGLQTPAGIIWMITPLAIASTAAAWFLYVVWRGTAFRDTFAWVARFGIALSTIGVAITWWLFLRRH